MIIVEGPDGAGKTTLINRINAEWGGQFVVQPRSVSKDAVSLVALDDYIEQELGKGFGPRLYDRFALISSPCYAGLPNRTFRGRMMDVDWLQMVHYQLWQIDPVVIVCLPPLDVVVANITGDDDNKVVQDDIEEIYIHYLNFIALQVNNNSLRVWDYTQANQQKLKGLLGWAAARIEEETQGKAKRTKKWKID